MTVNYYEILPNDFEISVSPSFPKFYPEVW